MTAIQRKKVIVISAHLLRSRSAGRDSDFLQPMIGLHIASLIDTARYEIVIHNEMSRGPFITDEAGLFDIAFLSGLQKDFDRMRQLSYFFRRSGAAVIAGGSICTLYPEFAVHFFDAVCTGSVDCVPDVMADYEQERLKPVYASAPRQIRDCRLDHAHLRINRISTPVHLIEASRGCNHACGFCTIPAEKSRHMPYGIERISGDIRNALKNAPLLSIRRFYPAIYFIDNHFTLDRRYTRELCTFLKSEKRIRGWGALISQDVLSDREMMKTMKDAGCRAVFTGLESIDMEVLKRNGKRQNMENCTRIIDEINVWQKNGIMVNFGYLFDPRVSSTDEMRNQLEILIETDILLFPCFLSFVSPLLGTRIFHESVSKGELLPGLLLRDLDGCTLAYSAARNSPGAVSDFAGLVFTNPAGIIPKFRMFRKCVRYIRAYGIKNPLMWFVVFANNFRSYKLFKGRLNMPRRSYIGGEDILDPQYTGYPADISEQDLVRYFKPVMVTDERGIVSEWLRPYCNK